MYNGKIMISDHWPDLYHCLSYLCTLSNLYVVYIPVARILFLNPIGH